MNDFFARFSGAFSQPFGRCPRCWGLLTQIAMDPKVAHLGTERFHPDVVYDCSRCGGYFGGDEVLPV